MKIDRLLTVTEEKQAIEFFNTHGDCYGNIIIKLTRDSGIGIGVIIKCKGCKAKKNITDYSTW